MKKRLNKSADFPSALLFNLYPLKKRLTCCIAPKTHPGDSGPGAGNGVGCGVGSGPGSTASSSNNFRSLLASEPSN